MFKLQTNKTKKFLLVWAICGVSFNFSRMQQNVIPDSDQTLMVFTAALH